MNGWKPQYSVNIKALDDQHKELFKMIGELSKALEQGKKLDLDYAVIKMEVYSLFHHTSEEELMEKYGYPEFKEHKKEHAEFRKKAAEFKERLKNDNSLLNREVIDFLEKWAENHILGTDLKYSPYLNAKGLR